MIRSAPTSRGIVHQDRHTRPNTGLDKHVGDGGEMRHHHLAPFVQDRRHRAAHGYPGDLGRFRCGGEQAVQEQRPFVRRPPLVGRDPPVRDHLTGLEQPDDGVAVADVGGEQGHLSFLRQSSARSMPRSKTFTEWVRAPTEMKSTPVSATSRARARVSPPEASRRGPPGGDAHRLGHGRGVHVVEQDPLAAGVEQRAQLVEVGDLDLDGEAGVRRADRVEGGHHPAGGDRRGCP